MEYPQTAARIRTVQDFVETASLHSYSRSSSRRMLMSWARDQVGRRCLQCSRAAPFAVPLQMLGIVEEDGGCSHDLSQLM